MNSEHISSRPSSRFPIPPPMTASSPPTARGDCDADAVPRSGALRSELALQVNTPVPDGLGGPCVESWVETATVFARIEPVSATSSFRPGPDGGDGDAPRDAALEEWRRRRHALRKTRQDFRHSDGARSGRHRALSRLPRQGGWPVKMAMQLTFDGMIRALRLKAHAVGEDFEEAERRAGGSATRALTLLASRNRRRLALEAGDEFGR